MTLTFLTMSRFGCLLFRCPSRVFLLILLAIVKRVWGSGLGCLKHCKHNSIIIQGFANSSCIHNIKFGNILC